VPKRVSICAVTASLRRTWQEQFFLNDYEQLDYDQTGQVQDTGAQVAPHLMPRVLCDSESARYPNVLQPRWPCQRIDRLQPCR
jgi:hypothetical protein